MKIVVSKEQYEQVRQAEKALGVKIALAPEEYQLRVIDNVNGQWGIYQVMRCYKGAMQYFADLRLVEDTATEQEAVFRFKALEHQKAKEGNLKVIYY